MSATRRGALILGGLIVFAAFACYWFPLVFLPNAGTAVALPVITVPAEYYREGWPGWMVDIFGFELVNSLGGALLANIIVVLVALGVWNASNKWTKQIPGRFQGAIELLTEGLWGLTKDQAGNSSRVRNLLFPLVASMFFFLLAANLGKLLPGVESVGVLHCAAYEPVAFKGMPVQEIDGLGTTWYQLDNDSALNTGQTATYESYHQCEAGLGYQPYIEDGYLATELDPFEDDAVVHTTVEGDTVASIAEQYQAEAEEITSGDLPDSPGREELQAELAAGQYEAIAIDYSDPYAQYDSWREVDITPDEVFAANVGADGVVSLAFEGLEDDGHGAEEEAGTGENIEGEGDPVEEAVTEEDVEVEEPETDTGTEVEVEPLAFTLPAGATVDTPLVAGQEVIVRPELIGEEATTRENQLYTVAPFVRGLATDLSFTIGLSILAFFAIQYFGLAALGPDYLQKFVNLRALGNAGENPIGAVDFIVGLFEIVSEVGKVVSLAFRLFGAIFAGTVLYAVIMFLTGTTTPVIILALELIVGTAQAGVFAILTLIFCAQAMVSHHGDDHDDAHH